MGRFLGRVAIASYTHPRRVLVGAVLLTIASILSLAGVDFEQNLMRLLPQELPSVRAFEKIRTRFDVERNLFILVEGPSEGDLIRLSNAYVERLRSDPRIASVQNRLSDDERRFFTRVLPKYFLLAMPLETLQETLAFLSDTVQVRAQLDRNYLRLRSAAPHIKEQLARDPLDLLGRTHSLSRWTGAAGTVRPTEEGYYLAQDGRSMLIHVRGTHPPQDIGYARELVRTVRESAPPGIGISLAGGYAVAVQDEAMIRGDMTRSSISAFILCLLLVWIAYRSPLPMVQIGLMLLIGLAWMLGAIAVIFGRLHPLLAASTAVVAGIGVDYGIYIMSRYRYEVGRGASSAEAVRRAYDAVGGGLFAAAATTVCVFLSFSVSELPGLVEFGIAAGCGAVLCFVSSIVVLPIFLRWRTTVRDARWMFPESGPGSRRVLFLSAAIVGVALLFTVSEGGGFSFEPNWKNLRPLRDPAIDAQERIGRTFWGSGESISVLTEGDPVSDATRVHDALEGLRARGRVASHRSVASLIPAEARQKATFESLHAQPAGTIAGLRKAFEASRFRLEAVEDYLKELEGALKPERMLSVDLLREEGLDGLMEPYISGSCSMIQIFPSGGLWESEDRERALLEIRTALEKSGVRFEMTGFKVVSHDLEGFLKRDFATLMTLSAALVLGVLLVSFRSPVLMLLALVPVGIGLILMSALMKLLGFHLNVMNLIAFPMVIGLGIDYGIHLTHLHRESSGEDFANLVPVSLQAVLMDVLTTVFGFAALVQVDNRGVASMGTVTALGILCCALPAMTTLPAILVRMKRSST